MRVRWSHLAVVLLAFFAGHPTHAYFNHLASSAAQDVTEPCSLHELPPGLWVQNADPQGRMLVGTKAAQNEIWHHQHPASCGPDTKFAVFRTGAPGMANGIGSMIHIIGVALAVAMNAGRVLVMGRESSFSWIGGPFCQAAASIDECWFTSFSNCSRQDLEAASKSENWQDYFPNSQDRVVTIVYPNHIGDYREAVPEVFRPMLNASGMPPGRWYYWWRSQAAAYMVRFPQKALDRLADHQRQIYPFGPVPRGAVSVHVRRGDKIIETGTSFTDTQFLTCVDSLFGGAASDSSITAGSTTAAPGAAGGTVTLQRHIVLSTEDALTVSFFRNLTAYNVTMTDVPRRGRDDTSSVHNQALTLGYDTELANSFVALDLALQCDAFVGELTSNWVRLIDELRSTVRCRAHAPFRDPRQPNVVNDFNW